MQSSGCAIAPGWFPTLTNLQLQLQSLEQELPEQPEYQFRSCEKIMSWYSKRMNNGGRQYFFLFQYTMIKGHNLHGKVWPIKESKKLFIAWQQYLMDFWGVSHKYLDFFKWTQLLFGARRPLTIWVNTRLALNKRHILYFGSVLRCEWSGHYLSLPIFLECYNCIEAWIMN